MTASDLQTVFAGLLVLLTAIYAWTTRRQLAAMKEALEQTRRSNAATEKSNEIAERSLELGNRAWLVATGIEPYSLAPGPGRKLSVTIENFGRIPATDMILRGFVGVQVTPDAPVGLVPTENVGSRAIVGPGRGLQAGIQFGNLTQDLTERIRAGQHALFAYCEIEYCDWFQRQRKTSACWKYVCETAEWAYAPSYNSLT